MDEVSFKPLLLSQRTIEAVRSMQRAEYLRLWLLFALAVSLWCTAFLLSPGDHAILRVSIVAAGLVACMCWGVRDVRLERRTYLYRALPSEQAARLVALASEFSACQSYLRALQAADRPLVGDDEYQLLALDPLLAHEWQHRERNACAQRVR